MQECWHDQKCSTGSGTSAQEEKPVIMAVWLKKKKIISECAGRKAFLNRGFEKAL